MADEYDDLYGDLYPGEAEFGAQATTTAAASTSAPAQAAAAPAASTSLPSAPAALPAAPAAQPAVSAIPSYSDAPAAQQHMSGQPAGLPNVPNPPPLHFAPNYAAQRVTEGRTAGVRPSDMPEEGKMFIGGLNWDTTDDTLKAYFEQFGRITNCMIMRDMETGRSRGFGFLTFEDVSSVNAVMAREHHLDGKTIDPKRAIPRSDTAKTDKLFVRALPASCTQESFRTYWRQFGSITDATLMMDKETGRHRGFGFVNYEHREDVDKVLAAGPHYMDGQMLEVKRAQAKGEPRSQNYGVNTNQHYTPQPMAGGGGAIGGMPMGGAGMGMGGAGMGGMGGAAGMGMGMGGMGAGAGGAGSPFDPAAMAKFFSSMGWGGWNPQMMMGGGMPGMGQGAFNPMMGGQGAFNPMMGMGGMGGMPMGQFGGSPMGAGAGAGAGPGSDGASEGAEGQGGSGFAAPMSMRGGRGGAMGGGGGGMMGGRGGAMGGRGGGRAGFNPPTGPAAMRDDGGAGPQRNRGTGTSFHPYSR